jgi:ABC-type spermidine/putrescine transport system permease subunit II
MIALTPLFLWTTAVTWVNVPKRGLNFGDLILLSLQVAALAAAVALALGTVLGVAIILFRRHQPPIEERLLDIRS